MKSFETLQQGDKIKNLIDKTVLTVVLWRNEKYFASDKSVWPLTEFNPADWKKIN